MALAAAVPLSSEESLEPGYLGDRDRLILSITTGVRLMSSGCSMDDVAEGFRIWWRLFAVDVVDGAP